jgi:hypothetical protein
MRPVVAVGLDSTVDVWVTFPILDNLEKFANEYSGRLAGQVRKGYKTVAAGKGDEISIDGQLEEAQKLVKSAKTRGIDIRYKLGGNGAQEAASFGALGSDIAFVGVISPSLSTWLSPKDQKFLKKINLSYASTSKYKPFSFILQARGTNRYILCEGRGRRIEQLRPYLRELPNALERILDKYGKLDMVNLVGWHVLFANGISDRDFRFVKGVIRKVRNVVDSPLFTDAGGLAAFDEREKRLLHRLYSLFDILSVNEDEVLQVSWAIGAEAKDEIQAMRNILESSEKLSTIWFHSIDYQASLSTKYGRELLEGAQVAAATAGVCRVEKGAYPTLGELAKRREIKNYSEKGLKATEHATKKYGGKIGDAALVATPCYKARSFASTVGAGDVAAAVYTYVIAGGKT